MTLLKTAYEVNIEFNTKLDAVKAKLKEVERLIAVSEKKIAENGYEKDKDVLKRKLASRKRYLKQIEQLETRHAQELRTIEAREEKKREQERLAAQKKGLTGYVNRWKAALDTISRYVTAAFVMQQVFKAVGDIAGDFLQIERTLLRISVITGETTTETNKLRTVIYNVAAGYAIGAREAAEFAFQMSKLGKTNEQTGRLANSAASLSVVLGEDLAASGKILVTTMNQFNLTTSESTKVAATFFRAIKESPLAVADLQTAMQYVGAAANAAGLEINEVGAAMQFLSNRGLRASKIGTGVRNVILKLAGDGRDFKTVMDEMAESGISLAEAVELFGKRGAIAGYTLINQWQEVKEMFAESMPTAIEQMQMTMRATTGILDTFAKKWNELKRFILGGEVDKDVELITKLNEAFEVLGLEVTDLGSIVRKGLKEGNVTDWLSYIIGDEKEIDRVNEFLSSGYFVKYGEELRKNLGEFAKILEQEIGTQSSVDARVKSFTNVVTTIGDYVREGLDKEVAINWLKAHKDSFIKGLTDADYSSKEALEKWEKVLIDGITRINNTDAYFDKAEMLRKFKEFNDGIDKIRNDFANGTSDNRSAGELDKLIKGRKALCDFAEKYGMPELCKDTVDKIDNELRNNVNALLDAYKKRIAELANKDAIEDAKLKQINEEVSRGFRDLLTFQQFKDQLEGKEGKKSQKEVLDAYQTYADDFLNLMQAKIMVLKKQHTENIKNDIGAQQGETDILLAMLKNLLGETTGEKDRAYLQGIINDYETLLIEMDTKLIQGVDKVNDSAANASEKIKDKGNDIASLIAKLLGVDKDSDLEDILDMVSEYLSTAADIYIDFANEIERQNQERWEREKESIQNRYEFEQDQLRMAAENNLVTQEQYTIRSASLEKARLRKINALEKKQFESKKKNDTSVAIADGIAQSAEAFIKGFLSGGNPVTGAILGALSAALVGAQAALKVSAIQKRQFTPVTFAEGGLVKGKSHAEGGVPFTVQGQGGYEMEGNEFIVKKSSVTPETLPILEYINNDKRYNSKYFASGGLVPDVSEGEFGSSKSLNQQTIIRAEISYKDLDAYERNKVNRDSNKNLLS